MPSPFPGMDPYLETPDLWPDVHHELISQIRSQLNPRLRPRYVARVELRVYVSGDDEVKEARIEIRSQESGALVTIIEVLSPANKVRGARGRSSFMAKRGDAGVRRALGGTRPAARRRAIGNPPRERLPLHCVACTTAHAGKILAGRAAPGASGDRHSAARARR